MCHVAGLTWVVNSDPYVAGLAARCDGERPLRVLVAELAEAWEQVEEKLMSRDDFRDFTFTNMVRLQAGLNRDFFKGTAVEAEAAKVLAQEPPGRLEAV